MMRSASALTTIAICLLVPESPWVTRFLPSGVALGVQRQSKGNAYLDSFKSCPAVHAALDSIKAGSHIPLDLQPHNPQSDNLPGGTFIEFDNLTDFALKVYTYYPGDDSRYDPYTRPALPCQISTIPAGGTRYSIMLNGGGGWIVGAQLANLTPAFYVDQLIVSPLNNPDYRATITIESLRPSAQNTPSSGAVAGIGVVTPSNIQEEIARIRAGQTAPMPSPQAAAASLGGQAGMVIQNGTSYSLTVLLSGPASQRIQLAPGGSQTITFPPGNYEVAASVPSPSVLPFYGKEIFGANTQYSERFYITNR